jgi:hypothetical protein
MAISDLIYLHLTRSSRILWDGNVMISRHAVLVIFSLFRLLSSGVYL